MLQEAMSQKVMLRGKGLKQDLKKGLKTTVMGIGLLVSSAAALAQAPAELVELNNQWQPLMNAKNTAALSQFYDAESLLGQYPYDSSKNLQGLEAISQMFAGGPFSLPELQAQIDTVALDARDDTALLVKNWQISFKDGGFKGLAVEVLENTPDGWKRRIDIGAGGLQSITELAANDLEIDNSAFAGLADDYAVRTADAVRVNLGTAALPDLSKVQAVDNLLSVQQGDSGLLVSRLNDGSGDYLLVNALQKSATGWQVKVQMSSDL